MKIEDYLKMLVENGFTVESKSTTFTVSKDGYQIKVSFDDEQVYLSGKTYTGENFGFGFVNEYLNEHPEFFIPQVNRFIENQKNPVVSQWIKPNGSKIQIRTTETGVAVDEEIAKGFTGEGRFLTNYTSRNLVDCEKYVERVMSPNYRK